MSNHTRQHYYSSLHDARLTVLCQNICLTRAPQIQILHQFCVNSPWAIKQPSLSPTRQVRCALVLDSFHYDISPCFLIRFHPQSLISSCDNFSWTSAEHTDQTLQYIPWMMTYYDRRIEKLQIYVFVSLLLMFFVWDANNSIRQIPHLTVIGR